MGIWHFWPSVDFAVGKLSLRLWFGPIVLLTTLLQSSIVLLGYYHRTVVASE